MTKNVVAKNWDPATFTLGDDGRLYSDPDSAPSSGNTVEPSVWPLELNYPRQAGSFPSGDVGTPAFPANHAVFWAHSGFAYNILPGVLHGSYPYFFWLTDAPAGMTINSSTGEVTWPSPSGTVTPTIHCRDAENTEVSAPWTIVTDDTKFRFINSATGSDAGAGTISDPWQTWNKAYTSGGTNIMVLRGGTYTTTGIPNSHPDAALTGKTVDTTAYTPTGNSFETADTRDVGGRVIGFNTGVNAGRAYVVQVWTLVGGKGHIVTRQQMVGAPASGDEYYYYDNPADPGDPNNWIRVDWRNSSSRPVQVIGFPGETAILDMGYTGISTNWGVFNRWRGSATTPVYIYNVTFRNHLYLLAQHEDQFSDYNVYAKIHLEDLYVGIDGSNAAGLDHVNGTPDDYSCYQRLTAIDLDAGMVKLYGQNKFLWDDFQYSNCRAGPDLKAHITKGDVRNIHCHDIYGADGLVGEAAGIFGNMNANGNPNGDTTVVVRYCLLNTNGIGVSANQDQWCGEVHFIRCTVIGHADVYKLPDTLNGPFRFRHCVIVNSDTTYTDQIRKFTGLIGEGPILTTPANVLLEDNLVGVPADGIVDANGALTGAYVSFIGSRGYQIP